MTSRNTSSPTLKEWRDYSEKAELALAAANEAQRIERERLRIEKAAAFFDGVLGQETPERTNEDIYNDDRFREKLVELIKILMPLPVIAKKWHRASDTRFFVSVWMDAAELKNPPQNSLCVNAHFEIDRIKDPLHLFERCEIAANTAINIARDFVPKNNKELRKKLRIDAEYERDHESTA